MTERPKTTRMSTEHFDIDRVRRNWERANTPEPVAPRTRFVEVRAPGDALAAGRDLLGRVRALAQAQFGSKNVTLAPFFAQAEDCLARVAAASSAGGTKAAAEREALVAACGDLEDLFEVLAGLGR